MTEPTWADQLSAWSTFATAVFSLIVALVAVVAWRTAKATLTASREASNAARESAEAARSANQQAKLDSVEQTRPYVYVEILPGLSSIDSWDLRITNAGRSAARSVTLAYDEWPDTADEVVQALQELFRRPRTLPT